MLYANQVPSEAILSQRKPQPSKSLFQGLAEVDRAPPARTTDQMFLQPSAPSKKAKQPFLKRGTGLQTRLEATKQRRYVPKGGFVKGQNDPIEQSTDRLTPQLIQHAGHYHHTHHSVHGPLQSTSAALQQAEVCDPAEAGSSQMQVGRPAQEWASVLPKQSKFAAGNAVADCDLEAEMDADSALVHFPSRPGTQASKQLPSNREQSVHSNFLEPQTLQHLHLPMHNQADSACVAASTRASLSQLHLSNPTADVAASEWQLQQAAEVCSICIHTPSQCSAKVPNTPAHVAVQCRITHLAY